MDKDPFISLLAQACQKRAPLETVTNAVRLVNGYGDALDGLVVERYNRHFVVQILDTQWLKHCQDILDFLNAGAMADYLIVKNRTVSTSADPGAIQSTVWLDNGASNTIVHENGVKFSIELNDTLNSGLFLDMRANRARVAALAAGRKVLNCFSYTCAFGLHCRVKGAAAVVNVDVGKKSLERGRLNYELNGIVPSSNEFIRADAVEYLERAVKKNNCFDMIIIDPPSFARFDGKSFSVKKDLAPLIAAAVRVLDPRGVLFVATNYSGMEPENLADMINEAADRRPVASLLHLGQDQDYPGTGLMPESYLAAVLAELA
jgi:23S rRNA (cytosine1962-C5)-methyltransferase